MTQATVETWPEVGACHGCHGLEDVARLWVVDGWYWHGDCAPVLELTEAGAG